MKTEETVKKSSPVNIKITDYIEGTKKYYNYMISNKKFDKLFVNNPVIDKDKFMRGFKYLLYSRCYSFAYNHVNSGEIGLCDFIGFKDDIRVFFDNRSKTNYELYKPFYRDYMRRNNPSIESKESSTCFNTSDDSTKLNLLCPDCSSELKIIEDLKDWDLYKCPNCSKVYKSILKEVENI